MEIRAVGILSPGEMGHNIALHLKERGLEVFTCLDGRSPRTKRLALLAQVKDLPSIRDLVLRSDLIISVVVPSAAKEVGYLVAQSIASTGRSLSSPTPTPSPLSPPGRLGRPSRKLVEDMWTRPLSAQRRK